MFTQLRLWCANVSFHSSQTRLYLVISPAGIASRGPPGSLPLGGSRYYSAICGPIGRLRMRLPVAAKIALHKAGVNGGTPGSPTPLEGTSMPAGTMWTRVSVGDSLMRTIG